MEYTITVKGEISKPISGDKWRLIQSALMDFQDTTGIEVAVTDFFIQEEPVTSE